jgi:outer membrane protein TolC
MTSALLLSLVVAQTPSLTMPQAIERALSQAPRISTVRASVQRAEALVVQSRAAWLPTLSVNGTFTQLEGNRGLADRVLVAAQTGSANLQLAFPLLTVPRWLATNRPSSRSRRRSSMSSRYSARW